MSEFQFPTMPAVLELFSSENNPRNSEGAFLETADGRLLFIYSRYNGNSPHDHEPADLAQRESRDGGRSWSAVDRIIMEHGDAESANLMSVSLLRLTNGRCLLFACRKFASADGTMNCIPSAAYSDDNAQSWSALRPLVKSEGYFILCNDRVVPLKSGKLIAPIATQDNRLQFWTSSNQGETWRCEPMTLSSDENNFSCRVYQEPGVVELANGTLWCWCRTDAQMQYGTFSQDEGKTWSEVRPMPDFRSPMAPMSVKRNPRNGHLVAVWDDHMPRWDVPPPIYTRPGWGDVSTGGRHPLVLAESSDEGCSWIQARRLESDTRRGFCYTAMHFTREALLLAYCCGGLNDTIMLQDMKLVRIPMRADGTLKLEGI